MITLVAPKKSALLLKSAVLINSPLIPPCHVTEHIHRFRELGSGPLWGTHYSAYHTSIQIFRDIKDITPPTKKDQNQNCRDKYYSV